MLDPVAAARQKYVPDRVGFSRSILNGDVLIAAWPTTKSIDEAVVEVYGNRYPRVSGRPATTGSPVRPSA